ncbi:glycosyltransferase [Asticcacaulis sp. EMRT-3]|uniref:glycosyltransferase n=1 Tax=Asticcacaulis sp. EMRT-3 TaxID=3040349 RepID=UPI0024AF7EC1|nr:glycosyltransferase [Asticcacaulis sp. EMRT-3]MDI7776467.1 glycosyltransferase [Asticcacaulis sp. EMRT-3]
MLFVIVTPSYNLDKFIEQTISSVVFQQGDFRIRYHIQDAGSTDKTHQIIQKWQRLIDGPDFPLLCKGVSFSYSVEKDNGMYDGINRGFDFARKSLAQSEGNSAKEAGQRGASLPRFSKVVPSAYKMPEVENEAGERTIMGWVNADDILFPGGLAAIASFFREHPSAQLVGGLVNIMASDGFVFRLWPLRGYSRLNMALGLYDGRKDVFVMQEGTFWCSELWDKTGGLNASLRYAGDYDLWYRFAQHTEYYQLDTLIASHRRRDGQLSSNLVKYFSEVDSLKSYELEQAFMDGKAKNKNISPDGTFHYDLESKSWKFTPLARQTWIPREGFSGSEGPFPEEDIVSGRWINEARAEFVLLCEVAGRYDVMIDYRNPMSDNEVSLFGQSFVLPNEAMKTKLSIQLQVDLQEGENIGVMEFAQIKTVPGDPRKLVIFVENIQAIPVSDD